MTIPSSYVFGFTLLSILSLTTSQTALSSYGLVARNISFVGEVYNSTDISTYINASVDFVVDAASTTNYSGVYVLDTDPSQAGMDIQAFDVQHYNGSTPANMPHLRLLMTIEEYDEDEAIILLHVENIGTNNAQNVTVYVDLYQGLKADYGTFSHYNADIYNKDGRRAFYWNVGDLATSASKNDSFHAYVDRSNMGDTNIYTSSVYFYIVGGSKEYGPMSADVCIDRLITVETSVLYQHGFTALSFFMALILGILLVILIFFIYIMLRRKKAVSPAKANQEKVMYERGKTIMMNENEAVKKQGHTINDYSVIGEGDSIVGALVMKDKMQMHREIDSLDIVNTVNIDTGLEKERNDASMATTELLLTGLHLNKDIDKGTLDSVLNNVRSRRQHLDKQQDEEYKREMKKLYKKISAKNRSLMNNLLQKQKEEKKELVSTSRDLPDKEREGLLNLMNEQHNSEQNAETYRLKLEQDEETEKLRKEFAIRGRMGMKEIQLQALADVKEQGRLSDPQVKWLMAEHQKNQKKLEGMYDEEISRQRMLLEEKLARRKALAQAAETQEDNNDYLLNTVASQQVILIEKLKKNKKISAANANEMIEDAKKKMMAIKDKTEKERAAQENTLHKRLSELKRKRLADLEKEQEAEIREYEKKCQEMQTDGPIDPMTYADGRLKILSHHREERNNMETQIDAEHLAELTKLRDENTTQTEAELKAIGQSVQTSLGEDGESDALIQKMMKEHEKEVAALRASQERDRNKQMNKLQERLEQNREQWNQRREAERVEQEQLREYEDQVVSKLVNSQVSMSDQERERILKEHEKQMVTLENSLTLNKLRQKRMLEEKLASRRAQQMEKLQQKQLLEKQSQKRQLENNGEESGDEESQRQKVELMKEHVEQKMAVLQGRKMEWDTEFENIRVEMMKERTLALKEQEERLGAMVAELQMAKAKEIAKIDEQQKAIHNLKTNLMEDLNSRGVLTDPETQAVIQRHHDEQDKLNQRLEEQRERQEQMLRQKLQQRLMQREKSLIQQQDEELKNLVAPSKTAAKIKKMLLIHNHMVAMEKMRNQLEREISQTLEQVKYEYEIIKRKAIQDQEMEFIAGLVRVGTIPKSELESVLKMLYPSKTEEDLKEILDKIFDPKLQTQAQSKAEIESQLAERVREGQKFPPSLSRRTSSMSMDLSRNRSLRGSKKKKTQFSPALEQQQIYNNAEYEDNSRFRPSSRQLSFDEHPHPLELGYSNKGYQANGNGVPRFAREEDDVLTAHHVNEGEDTLRAQALPAKLPPLQAGRKKKKKKFLKKMAHENDEELL